MEEKYPVVYKVHFYDEFSGKPDTKYGVTFVDTQEEAMHNISLYYGEDQIIRTTTQILESVPGPIIEVPKKFAKRLFNDD